MTSQPTPRAEVSELTEVMTFISRFVAYPSIHAQVAHALWILHAHLMECWETTPRLAFLSAEPASGKTRALEISALLVPNPIEAVNVSSAYLFRKAADEAAMPTILYDEIDTVFGPKARENEDIRGFLNAGHHRGAVAGRCVVRGRTIETEDLPAYCALAIAGLGFLPDTLMCRSIVVRMRRRRPDEHLEPYRRRVHHAEGHAIKERLELWATRVKDELQHAWPSMPDTVTDRDSDMWEPLIAIADSLGGEWPALARVTAVTLVTDSMGDRGSLGVRLLSDLRVIFGDSDALFTEEIINRLVSLEEAPWGELRDKDKPLNPRGLAQRLRAYEVSSKTVRVGGGTAKGYRREDLADAWERYLSVPPQETVTSVHKRHNR